MAERRMFAKTIIDSDAFIEMPLSSQALYFHLAMRADDDGFVNNPRRISNDVGASADDLKLLIAKRFVLSFESGVIVIKHWRMHNYIQKDRYKPTAYIKELSLLMVTENKSYTECIHNVSEMDTQVRLELDLGKDRGSIGKDIDNTYTTTTTTIPSMARERASEKETLAGEGESQAPPTASEVALYMREVICVENTAAEAEKFVAWNAKWGWDCLPNWKGAAELWCARIPEKDGGGQV